MPFDENHPIITLPDENIDLWRYMDIPSFLSLLVDQSLTFVRGDLFEDKYEGILPEMTAAAIDKQILQKIQTGKIDSQYSNFSKILHSLKNQVYLNCWCKERHEMVHMWKIYSKEKGVAIETNYETLKESIRSKETVLPTLVNYVDFKNDIVSWASNGLTAFTLKRKEYKSENEFRLILSYPRIVEDQLLELENQKEIDSLRRTLYLNTPVVKCEVDVNKLIKRIHLSPYAPKWYLNLIEDLVKKYNLNPESITQSDL